jgi:Cu+-exporting ATPase
MRIRTDVLCGLVAAILLLVFYFAIISFISGWGFAALQFRLFWYFIVSLAIGFGIQVGLYAHLKKIIRQQGNSGKVLAVSGTTSGAAMVSCCAHYLANILPVIGATGVIGLIGQYQVELFWLGLIFNAAGIFYIARQIFKFRHL